MKMFNYLASGALTLLLMLWAALLFDTGNLLYHIAEALQLIEQMLQKPLDE